MGSLVSAVVANLYMEFFEELALKTVPTRPRLTIKFTVEQEEDGALPFLNTLYSGEERMAARLSLSTGSPRIWTGISTSIPSFDPRGED